MFLEDSLELINLNIFISQEETEAHQYNLLSKD